MLFTDRHEFFFQNRRIKKEVKVRVTWLDHQPSCATCRAVDVAKTATLAAACAVGAPLLAEHLVTVSKPASRAREAAVLKWADGAGTFKTRSGDRAAVKLATLYKK